MEGEKRYISAEELKEHNKSGDLWISIQGKVYDVSEWAKEHPGGEIPLLNLAGQDVTDAFLAYHPGTAWQYLDKLFTGYHLKDFEVSEVSKDYRRLVSEFAKADVIACGHILGRPSCWACFGCKAHTLVTIQVITRFYQGNCLTGISIAWWKWTHNAHHIACNSLDHDPDLQHIPVFAVSSHFFTSLTSSFYGRTLNFDPLARFLVSYQHWTYYPVMIVARVNLFVQTFLLLFSNRSVPDRGFNIMGILVFWTWFPLLVSCLPNWPERIMFVLVSFAVTSIQHVQFTLNHFSANVYVGLPTGNDWFEKQTSGTIDISCPSMMDWFFGGLQFQLEHHLFPRLPRCHLRKVSPLVRELCKKHKLPYRSLSFWEANKSTIRTLRTAALQARDLTNPAPKNLLWEAFNTHG
ncbi:hypothetical protein GOBAR_DD22024 [Gossypium barbadense]|nr:hypothetical protein GOBAR_DD22024 [Gossypium barbadense]